MTLASPPLVLVTGFSPFPGAPVNPSAVVARRLAEGSLGRRLGIRIAAHVFPTTYRALADLPAVVAAFEPDACLHLGIAARSRFMRIETRATNFAAPFLPDAEGLAPDQGMIEPGAGRFRGSTIPVRRIRDRIAGAGLPARLSGSAGRYLCNACLWHSLALADRDGSARPTGFLHLPVTVESMPRRPRGPAPRPTFTISDLLRAAELAIQEISTILPT
ncbi:pyroglutamyl-peptidase I [Prosthecomicrobium sp. N25]|uniref:pyroglutamyl-peptidase I n=1 Tax=Prosthecomicrobium sp. N25 TaxID=3129254 RepID=UPI003076A069